jgi:hypothetical protein
MPIYIETNNDKYIVEKTKNKNILHANGLFPSWASKWARRCEVWLYVFEQIWQMCWLPFSIELKRLVYFASI